MQIILHYIFVLMFNEKRLFIVWRLEADKTRINLPLNKNTMNTAQVRVLKLSHSHSRNHEHPSSLQSQPSICSYLCRKKINKKVSTHLLYARPWVQSADWNFRLRLSSKWSPRRYKDVNPQWNFLIPATCHCVHRLRWVENSQWASGWLSSQLCRRPG